MYICLHVYKCVYILIYWLVAKFAKTVVKLLVVSCVHDWWFHVWTIGGFMCGRLVVSCVDDWWFHVWTIGGFMCGRLVVSCMDDWWFHVWMIGGFMYG